MPSEPEITEHELRLRVEQLLDDCQLPLAASDNVIAGYGTGQACVVCGERIGRDQVQYQIENGGILFHPRCHKVWQQEVRQRAADL